MSLIRKSDSHRVFFPANLWKPLGQIQAEHFFHFCTPDRYGLWEERRIVWNQLETMVRRMETGEFFGSLKTLDVLRFFESLYMCPDPYIRLASFVSSHPIIEDLIFLGGFQNLVEDFFLKKYGVPARFLPFNRADAVAVRIPDITTRLATGHPSVKQIIRDFNKKTRDFWIIEFDCFNKGPIVFFTVQLPPIDLDNPEMNHDMIMTELSLVDQMVVTV